MNKTAFGIDLGTTYSCIAYVDENGKPVVVPDSVTHMPVVPSVVYFADGNENCVVGEEAKRMLEVEPDSTVAYAKRAIGIKDKKYEIHGEEMLPQSISSQVLKRLVKSVKDKTGMDVKDVVITCPAYFGIEERAATINAGELAGLNVRAILDEPTAAAYAYGLENAKEDKEQTILVYDLGGGTFDVTIMRQKGYDFNVICTGGDHQLGGKDWDDKLFNHLVNLFCEEKGKNKADLLADHEATTEMRLNAEKIKCRLTEANEARYNIKFDGESCRGRITREEFDKLTEMQLEDTIAKTLETIERAKAKCETDSIPFSGKFDELLLVGGSSKMPMVLKAISEQLAEHIKKEPIIFEPDESIAKGASIYAQQIVNKEDSGKAWVGEKPEITSSSVCSRSFGVGAYKSGSDDLKVFNLVYQNTNLPLDVASDQFAVRFENQASVSLSLYENLEDKEVIEPTQATLIGEAEITGIPAGLKQGTKIEVNFHLSKEGILSGGAIEKQFNTSINFEFKTERVELVKAEDDPGSTIPVSD